MVDSFPLRWPLSWKRTGLGARKPALFKTSFGAARDGLLGELRMLGAREVVISSNIPMRLDGLPYANYNTPADSGVAVYFVLNGRHQCIPCDKWVKVVDNLQAINLTVAALRGLERWGAKEMMDAAFSGFIALEDKSHVDYFKGCLGPEAVKARYSELVKKLHPDLGGNPDEFMEMKKQYDRVKL